MHHQQQRVDRRVEDRRSRAGAAPASGRAAAATAPRRRPARAAAAPRAAWSRPGPPAPSARGGADASRASPLTVLLAGRPAMRRRSRRSAPGRRRSRGCRAGCRPGSRCRGPGSTWHSTPAGQLGELADEPVPARDLERDASDLPRSLRRLERPVDPARPAARRPGSRRARPRGRAGSSSRCRRRGSARRRPGRRQQPGTAALAITASTTRPLVNQCSAARSMLAAHTWKVTGSSSKVRSPSSSSSRWRSGSADHRWVPDRTARRTVRSGRSPYPVLAHSRPNATGR